MSVWLTPATVDTIDSQPFSRAHSTFTIFGPISGMRAEPTAFRHR
jgi:hypothetical protein